MTDGFKVQLTEGPTEAGKESSLNFVVARNGHRLQTQDYLGAGSSRAQARMPALILRGVARVGGHGRSSHPG
jgi:hypothetical protein